VVTGISRCVRGSYCGIAVAVVMTLLAALMPTAADAATSARADRNSVQITDSFQVVFETDQDVSSRPDFSALGDDFDVLGTSQSTSVNVVNGRMQRSARWIVDLMAKSEGVFTIPSIRIGNEQTNSLLVTVQPAKTAAGEPAGDVFLEVEVDTESPYVQQQVVLTIRLLRAVQTGNASLTEPNVRGTDVVIEKLGDDVGYETRRGDVRLAVVERRYALFAQQSGSIVVDPFLFEGRVAAGRQSAFDPFARGRIVRVRSDAVELEVRPIPADFTGPAWLPARQVFLVESWPDDGQQFRAGEPVTRTLTLQANGLASSQLPDIAAGVPDGLRQYPDQPLFENRVVDGGLVGVRQEKVALIPSRAGTLTLPAVEVPWWNTRTDRVEYARLAARTLEIAPAAAAADASARPIESADTGPSTGSSESAQTEPVRAAGATPWVWVSLGLGVAWVLTIFAWWRARRRGGRQEARPAKPPGEKQLVAAVREACGDNDPGATKDALLAWAANHWPGSQVRSLGELAARLDGDVQLRIHELGRGLYRESGGKWDGGPLWTAFNAVLARRAEAPQKKRPELEPLYLR